MHQVLGEKKKSKKIKTHVLSASEFTQWWGWSASHLFIHSVSTYCVSAPGVTKIKTQSLPSGCLSPVRVDTVKCSRHQFRGKIRMLWELGGGVSMLSRC